MILHFILSSLCFIAVTQGYPATKPTQKECCINHLPLEVLSQIFENADSLPTLSNCAQSCKYWNQVLSSKSYNTLQHAFRQQPAKKKHLLQSLVEPSLGGNRLEEYVAVKNLDAIQSDGELCSVEQYWLIQAAVKYGNIDALDLYYDQVIQNITDTSIGALEGHMQRFLLFPRQPSNRIVYDWLFDRLSETERDMDVSLANIKVIVASASLGLGYELDYQPSNEMEIVALSSASARSGNHTLYSKYSRLAQTMNVPADTLLHNLALCKTCDEHDLMFTMNALQQSNLEHNETQHIPMTFITACEIGSPSTIRMFLSLPQLHTNVTDCLRHALYLGKIENIEFIQKEFPTVYQSTLVEVLPVMHRLPVDSLNYLIRESGVENLVSTVGVQEAFNGYARRACGNDMEMNVIIYFTTVLNAQVTDEIFKHVISRPQFGISVSPATRYCPRNESTQIMKYFLQELKFIPNQNHLNAALAIGRFDIVQMVYETGRENGADLVIDRESINTLLPSSRRQLWSENNFYFSSQDLELLDYVFEKAFGKGWNRDSLSEEDMQLIREFHGARSVGIFENARNHSLDCYYAYLRHLKLVE